MKKIITFSMVFVLFSTLFTQGFYSNNKGHALKTEDVPNKKEGLIKYDFIEEDVLPIVGYNGIQPAGAGNANNPGDNPSFMTKSNFQLYKDAGFNLVCGLYENVPNKTPEVKKAIDICGELGIGYLINHLGLNKSTLEETVEYLSKQWYIDKPGFAGLALDDEPSMKQYPEMGLSKAALDRVAPTKLAFSTLYPMYAKTAQFGITNPSEDLWTNYKKYVGDFIDIVNPDVLVYDHYVFHTHKVSELTYTNGHRYFDALSYYRGLSKELNIPFWVSVSSYKHAINQNARYTDIRWQVNTSMAYGAKGLQYYTYWSLIGGQSIESWKTPSTLGLVSDNGIPHDSYYVISDINAFLHSIDNIIMTSEHLGVKSYGSSFNYTFKDRVESTLPLKDVTGGNALLGMFKKQDGKNAYYLTHNDIYGGIKTYKLDFINKSNIRVYSENGITNYNDVYSIGVNLAPGEACVVEVL